MRLYLEFPDGSFISWDSRKYLSVQSKQAAALTKKGLESRGLIECKTLNGKTTHVRLTKQSLELVKDIQFRLNYKKSLDAFLEDIRSEIKVRCLFAYSYIAFCRGTQAKQYRLDCCKVAIWGHYEIVIDQEFKNRISSVSVIESQCQKTWILQTTKQFFRVIKKHLLNSMKSIFLEYELLRRANQSLSNREFGELFTGLRIMPKSLVPQLTVSSSRAVRIRAETGLTLSEKIAPRDWAFLSPRRGGWYDFSYEDYLSHPANAGAIKAFNEHLAKIGTLNKPKEPKAPKDSESKPKTEPLDHLSVDIENAARTNPEVATAIQEAIDSTSSVAPGDLIGLFGAFGGVDTFIDLVLNLKLSNDPSLPVSTGFPVAAVEFGFVDEFGRGTKKALKVAAYLLEIARVSDVEL